MSRKTKLKIGAFSKMMQVTVKTLRHYEQKGLLVPDVIKIGGVCQELKKSLHTPPLFVDSHLYILRNIDIHP